MENICIHCAQNPPCTNQDGIYCRAFVCARDGMTPGQRVPGQWGRGADEFVRQFSDMFSGKGGPNGTFRQA